MYIIAKLSGHRLTVCVIYNLSLSSSFSIPLSRSLSLSSVSLPSLSIHLYSSSIFSFVSSRHLYLFITWFPLGKNESHLSQPTPRQTNLLPLPGKKNHKLKLVEVLPIHNTESQYTLLKVVNLPKLHCSTKVFTSYTANKCLHSTLLAGLRDTMSSSLYYLYLEPALGLVNPRCY